MHENGTDYTKTMIPVPKVDALIPELIFADEDEDDKDEEINKEPDNNEPKSYSPLPGIEDAQRAYEDL